MSLELDSNSKSYQYYFDPVNYSDYGQEPSESHEVIEVSRSSEEPDTVYLNSYEK